MDQHKHKIYDTYVSYTLKTPSLNWMNLLISVVVFARDTKYKKPEPSDSKKYQHIIVENNNLSPLVPNHSSILAERSLFLKKSTFSLPEISQVGVNKIAIKFFKLDQLT